MNQENLNSPHQPDFGAQSLKAVLDQISAGVMIVEASSGKALQVNDRVREIWRRDISEDGSLRYDEFQAFWLDGSALKPHEWQSYRSIHEGISIRDEEMEILRGDHTRGYISVSSDPILDDEGKIHAAVITIHDITELRRQEMVTRLLDEATQFLFSDLDYEKTLENFAALAVGRLGGWVRVSLLRDHGQMEPIATLHEDPEKTELLRKLRVYYPFDPQKPNVEYRVLNSGESIWTKNLVGDSLNQEARDERHKEIIRELRVTSTITVPLKSKQASFGVIKFGSYIRTFDETDFRLAEELGKRASLAIENAILYKKAQEAICTRDDFLSIASHELKTPLTTLRLHSQLRERYLEKGLAEEFKLDKIKKMIATDHRQVGRLIRLVDDMLDVSRIHAGHLSMDFASIDLSGLIEEVVIRMIPEFKSKYTLLSFVPSEGVRVEGDRIRLEQLFENLLTNALKYGCGKPVQVELKESANAASISVRDQGMGIASKNFERIFQRFERAVSTNEVSGLGLGLHIAREIANGHGGEIRVESELGKGATFWVELPKKQVGNE